MATAVASIRLGIGGPLQVSYETIQITNRRPAAPTFQVKEVTRTVLKNVLRRVSAKGAPQGTFITFLLQTVANGQKTSLFNVEPNVQRNRPNREQGVLLARNS